MGGVGAVSERGSASMAEGLEGGRPQGERVPRMRPRFAAAPCCCRGRRTWNCPVRPSMTRARPYSRKSAGSLESPSLKHLHSLSCYTTG